MPTEPRTLSLAQWFRAFVKDTLTGERYVSKVVTTGKGNHWFSVTELDGTYVVLVKKIDPED